MLPAPMPASPSFRADSLEHAVDVRSTGPLLVREHITSNLLLLTLHELYICEHSIRLESLRQLTRHGSRRVETGKRDELEDETRLGEIPDKVFKVLVEKPWALQLKLGLRLYTSHLPADRCGCRRQRTGPA